GRGLGGLGRHGVSRLGEEAWAERAYHARRGGAKPEAEPYAGSLKREVWTAPRECGPAAAGCPHSQAIASRTFRPHRRARRAIGALRENHARGACPRIRSSVVAVGRAPAAW